MVDISFDPFRRKWTVEQDDDEGEGEGGRERERERKGTSE